MLGPADVWITAADGTRLHAWWVPNTNAKFTFLAFHGNASNIAKRAPTYEFLRDSPANVLALEYRGYGHSEGKPSEAGLYLDAEAAYQYLVNTRRLDPKSIVSFGQSVGTTVAVDLAAHHEMGGRHPRSAFPFRITRGQQTLLVSPWLKSPRALTVRHAIQTKKNYCPHPDRPLHAGPRPAL